MSEKLLIIGGTGFIGKNLTVNAVFSGYHVTVLSLNTPDRENMVKDVDYLQADISDFLELQERLVTTNFDYVVNLSGYIDHRSFLDGGRKVISDHFIGVQNIIQLINWNTLKRFVQIGSSDEYGGQPAPQNEGMRESPISPYSLGKMASTQLLQMLYRTERFPAVTLRLFLVYGPGQNNRRFLPQIIQQCLLDRNFPTSSGEQLRDFCYVDDISRGILMALTNDEVNGEVINLASGKPVAISEVVEQVKKIVGQGMPEYGKIDYRKGENMALYADNTLADQLLGWKPEVSLEEGIKRTIDYFQLEVSQ